MTPLSPDFQARLDEVFQSLGSALARPAFRARLEERTHEARLEGDTVAVPVRFEVHWRRFGTVPTDLVRSAAYAAARATGRMDDADAQVFAEAFLRDHVLNAD